MLCVCDSSGPLGTEVHEFDLGICIEWPQIDTLVPRLQEILHGSDRLAQMQENAFQRAKFYQRATVIKKVEQELQRLVQRNSRE